MVLMIYNSNYKTNAFSGGRTAMHGDQIAFSVSSSPPPAPLVKRFQKLYFSKCAMGLRTFPNAGPRSHVS